MLFNFKKKPAYFSVHALRDGTIWLARLGRKPPKKEKPTIDEDGIFEWFLDEDEPQQFTDWGKCLRHVAVATTLNTKRIVRQQVEAKLDQILDKLDAIEKRLDAIDAAQ